MKLTVLGCSTPLPQRENPCSGFIVSTGTDQVLIDCGSGVFPHLVEVVDPATLTAVWISHLHPDHWADLITFANWALNDPSSPKLVVHGPSGWDKRLNAFLAGHGQNVVDEVFTVNYIEDGQQIQAGQLLLESRLVAHSVTSYGLRISSEDGTLAYSGDTGPCQTLRDIAKEADLFLCEAGSTTPTAYHLTQRQARDVARNADVGRLVITHVPAGADRPAGSSDDVPSEFAYAGGTWTVGRHSA